MTTLLLAGIASGIVVLWIVYSLGFKASGGLLAAVSAMALVIGAFWSGCASFFQSVNPRRTPHAEASAEPKLTWNQAAQLVMDHPGGPRANGWDDPLMGVEKFSYDYALWEGAHMVAPTCLRCVDEVVLGEPGWTELGERKVFWSPTNQEAVEIINRDRLRVRPANIMLELSGERSAEIELTRHYPSNGRIYFCVSKRGSAGTVLTMGHIPVENRGKSLRWQLWVDMQRADGTPSSYYPSYELRSQDLKPPLTIGLPREPEGSEWLAFVTFKIEP